MKRACGYLMLCVLASSCGGGGGGEGAADSTPGAELCNGIDDTADGRIDEGCACTDLDVSLVTPSGLNRPSLAWTGGFYFVTVDDASTLSIAPLVDGVLGTAFDVGPVVPSLFANKHSMAWSGMTLGVVRVIENLSSELVIFDVGGSVLHREPLSNEANWTEITWVGDRFLIVGFTLGSYDPVVIAEHAADGTQLAAPSKITSGPVIGTGYPLMLDAIHAIAASDTTYVVVGSRLNDPFEVAIDRATRTATTYLLDLGRVYSSISAARHGLVFETSRGDGGGLTGGDGLQLLDASGVPQLGSSLPWTGNETRIVTSDRGYTAVTIMPASGTTKQYASVQLDEQGIPLSQPVIPIATFDSSGYSLLQAVSASGRFAFAHRYQTTLRFVQRCEQ